MMGGGGIFPLRVGRLATLITFHLSIIRRRTRRMAWEKQKALLEQF